MEALAERWQLVQRHVPGHGGTQLPLATVVIVGLIFAVFALEEALGGSMNPQVLELVGAMVPDGSDGSLLKKLENQSATEDTEGTVDSWVPNQLSFVVGIAGAEVIAARGSSSAGAEGAMRAISLAEEPASPETGWSEAETLAPAYMPASVLPTQARST